jgi:hypothetical protein
VAELAAPVWLVLVEPLVVLRLALDAPSAFRQPTAVTSCRELCVDDVGDDDWGVCALTVTRPAIAKAEHPVAKIEKRVMPTSLKLQQSTHSAPRVIARRRPRPHTPGRGRVAEDFA